MWMPQEVRTLPGRLRVVQLTLDPGFEDQIKRSLIQLTQEHKAKGQCDSQTCPVSTTALAVLLTQLGIPLSEEEKKIFW